MPNEHGTTAAARVQATACKPSCVRGMRRDCGLMCKHGKVGKGQWE